MSSELLAAVLALIGFVLTQGFLKFIIEPIQEQRRVIGEVAHLISTVLNVPEGHGNACCGRPITAERPEIRSEGSEVV